MQAAFIWFVTFISEIYVANQYNRGGWKFSLHSWWTRFWTCNVVTTYWLAVCLVLDPFSLPTLYLTSVSGLDWYLSSLFSMLQTPKEAVFYEVKSCFLLYFTNILLGSGLKFHRGLLGWRMRNSSTLKLSVFFFLKKIWSNNFVLKNKRWRDLKTLANQ